MCAVPRKFSFLYESFPFYSPTLIYLKILHNKIKILYYKKRCNTKNYFPFSFPFVLENPEYIIFLILIFRVCQKKRYIFYILIFFCIVLGHFRLWYFVFLVLLHERLPPCFLASETRHCGWNVCFYYIDSNENEISLFSSLSKY